MRVYACGHMLDMPTPLYLDISCLPKGGPSDKAVGGDSLKSGESGDSLPMKRPELHAQEVMKYISPH